MGQGQSKFEGQELPKRVKRFQNGKMQQKVEKLRKNGKMETGKTEKWKNG